MFQFKKIYLKNKIIEGKDHRMQIKPREAKSSSWIT